MLNIVSKLFFAIGLIVLVVGTPQDCLSQPDNRVITGSVFDKTTGEVLIGASIVIKNTNKGTITNPRGQYTLWLPANMDSVELMASHMGHVSQVQKYRGAKVVDWYLHPDKYSLDEVIIYEDRNDELNRLRLKAFSIRKIELNSLPSFAGEKDLLLFMQLLPGIQIAGDGNSNIYARGGSYDQNLFLLDDIPLYHVSHIGGITSTFNADIIKSVDVYLGAFPARYGGRLSSVVDIRTKDGDMFKHRQKLTLGMLTSKLCLEGPIVQNRTSYLVSARKNTIPFFKWIWDRDEQFNLYDLNLKINYQISPDDRIFFSFYSGSDGLKFSINNDSHMKSSLHNNWGNHAGSVRYHKRINARVSHDFILGHSTYFYKEKSLLLIGDKSKFTDQFSSEFLSSISDNIVKTQFDFELGEKIKGQAGYEFIYHQYNPGKSKIKQTGPSFTHFDISLGYPTSSAFEHNIFAEFPMADVFGFTLEPGIRWSIFKIGQSMFEKYQPRLIIAREFGRYWQAKMAYTSIWQPFHVVSNNSAGIPTDYRIPANDAAPPSISDQFSIGLSYRPQGEYETSVEAYSKSMKMLADLKEGVAYTLDFSGWEKIIANRGTGTAKGIEFMVRKTRGASTGWLGAHLGKTTRQFKDINMGKAYPYKYDRRVDFTLYFQQRLTSKTRISSTWVFGSGNPYSLPHSQYQDHEGNHVFIYGELNNLREKPYHRLDVGITYTTARPRWETTWDFGVINLYNRKNPYFYFTRIHMNSPVLYQFSLFPVMPYVTFSLSRL